MKFFRKLLLKRKTANSDEFKIAVLGLGVFGQAVTRALFENDIEVLAIDRDRDLVNRCKEFSTESVILDVTNQEGLAKFSLQEYSAVVVAIGNQFENSFLATAYLKEIGAKYVIARATSEINRKILHKIGADEVISPEEEIGHHLGYHLAKRKNLHAITVRGNYCISEIEVPAKLLGQSLPEQIFEPQNDIQVLLVNTINEEGALHSMRPKRDTILNPDDKLSVFGDSEKIDEFIEEFS